MRRRLTLALLLLATFAVALGVVIHLGEAIAYKAPATTAEHLDTTDTPAEPTARAGRIVTLDLPAYPQPTGTDAGLITTPAS